MAVDSIYYGMPILHDRPGLKVAHHYRGAQADPDLLNRNPTPEDEMDFRPALREYIPIADGPLLGMSICMYTNSPDSHFIIDHHPGHENVIVACGFSGHGFKFASVIGEALADLAEKGRSELPIGFLRLNRFLPLLNPDG